MFSHDTELSLLTVVDLVNTAAGCGGTEQLPTARHVEQFIVDHHFSGIDPRDYSDLPALYAVRDRFRSVFGLGDAAKIAAQVNAMVAVAPVSPRLTDHEGYPWHMHYFAPGASLAEHLSVDGGMALAHVVSLGETDRLRICAAPDCNAVLIDLSRNRSKRYCDARACGNRLHVAAYRKRQRSGSAPLQPS